MQTRPARPLWPNPSLQNQLTGQSTPWPRPRPVFVRCSLVPRLHPTHARIKEKGSGHVTNGKRMETDINTESFCNHSNLLCWAIAEYLVVAKRSWSSPPSDISSEPDSLVPSSLVPRLFLVEERAWQHWGVGAVYFRYVMVHVIYSIDNRGR